MGIFAQVAAQQNSAPAGNLFDQAKAAQVTKPALPYQVAPTIGPTGTPITGLSALKQNVGALGQEVSGALPAAGAIGGGFLGGLAGATVTAPTIAGIPAGAYAGAVGGAALGGAAGTAAAQKLQGQALNPSQIALSGATSGAIEAVTGGLGLAFKAAAKSPLLAGIAGKMTGYAQDVLDTALQRTPGAVNAVTKGESALVDVVKDTSAKLSTYAQNLVDEGKQTVDNLSKLSGGGKGYPGTRQALLAKGMDFVQNITNTLRTAYNIGVKSTGLDFARSTMPSNIVSGGDKASIQDAFDTVANIAKDTSINNINAVIERLITLKSKTPVGSVTGPETRKVIGDMIDKVVGFTRSLGSVTPAYKQYADYLEQNIPKRVFVNDAKEMFEGTKNLSAKEISAISSRLLNVFKTGKQSLKDFAGQVGTTLGTDPVGATAGTIINAGDKVSLNPTIATPRGIVAKVVEILPRTLVQNFIKTGNMAALELHPIIQATAKAAGTTAKAIAQLIGQSINQSQN